MVLCSLVISRLTQTEEQNLKYKRELLYLAKQHKKAADLEKVNRFHMPKDNEVCHFTWIFQYFYIRAVCIDYFNMSLLLFSVPIYWLECLLVAYLTTGVSGGQSYGNIKEIFTFSGYRYIYWCWLAKFENAPWIYVLFILSYTENNCSKFICSMFHVQLNFCLFSAWIVDIFLP